MDSCTRGACRKVKPTVRNYNLEHPNVKRFMWENIVTRIMMMLEGIPFGKYYFEVACILWNTLLVSSLLCNSEAWYNLTNSEVKLLESIDLMLLRKILNAPKSTPKEILYLELGCIPLKFIIQKRRQSFLQLNYE